MRHFDTLIEALQQLQQEGYTYDFNLLSDRLYCKELRKDFMPAQFEVDEIFRFEGDSNPSDNSILLAVTTNTGIKGTLLDAYGAYSQEMHPALLKKLLTQ
jgi:hypothetical protein